MSEEPVFVPQQVVCPGCGQSFHETTPLYDPEKCASGIMFALRPAYGPNGANWSSFAQDESIRHDDLCCPGCGSSYSNGGTRVRLRENAVRSKNDQISLEDAQADADSDVQEHRNAVMLTAELVGPAESEPEPDGAQLEDAPVEAEVVSDELPELTEEDDEPAKLPPDAEVRSEVPADAKPIAKCVKTMRIGD